MKTKYAWNIPKIKWEKKKKKKKNVVVLGYQHQLWFTNNEYAQIINSFFNFVIFLKIYFNFFFL